MLVKYSEYNVAVNSLSTCYRASRRYLHVILRIPENIFSLHVAFKFTLKQMNYVSINKTLLSAAIKQNV